jgi:hypothetical protein
MNKGSYGHINGDLGRKKSGEQIADMKGTVTKNQLEEKVEENMEKLNTIMETVRFGELEHKILQDPHVHANKEERIAVRGKNRKMLECNKLLTFDL